MTEFCGHALESPFWLAPMAGITDSAFRTICRQRGAALTYTEMVSAKALVYNDKKTHEIISIDSSHRPCALQLFGSEPEVMAEAARIAADLSHPEIIDINMGCPVPKIVGNGEGSALMKNVVLATRIISAVAAAVSVPVTVKIRAGFNEGERTAPELAKALESAGAKAICVHGRTRSQMYSGQSDREIIALAKRAVGIPVIASGDALSPRACMEIFAQTGADAIMIARGALGNPLIFEDCLAAQKGASPPPRTADSLLDLLLEHASLTCLLKGERRAVPELRKQALWYLGRLSGSKPFKAEMAGISSLLALSELVGRIKSADLRFRGYSDE